MLKRVNIIQDNCYVGYINSHGNNNLENTINAASILFTENDEYLFSLNYNNRKFIGTILNPDKTNLYYEILSNSISESLNINKKDIDWKDYLTHNKLNLTREDEIDPYDMAF